MAIRVTKDPTAEDLERLGVLEWPIWTHEIATFPWTYDEPETCFFLEGLVEITPDGGSPVTVGRGDLVRFPSGMHCTWTIREAVRKHYRFG